MTATPANLRWIRTLACRAYAIALHGPPGPVHLNFPLREPLVLDRPLPEDDTGREDGSPYVVFDAPEPRIRGGSGHPEGRVLIVAGRDEHPDGAPAQQLEQLAAGAGFPLLADPLSGARRGEAAIAHYDLLLRDPSFADAHRPDWVIRVGDLPTSKPLRAWLASLDAAQIAIDSDDAWHDPDTVVGMRISAPVRALLDAAGEQDPPSGDHEWLASWRAADAAAERAIDESLGERALRAAGGTAAGRMAATTGDAVRRLLDADPRRRVVRALALGRSPGPLQPRRQRDRRNRVVRVRRRGGERAAGRLADRRRRARARYRWPSRGPPAGARPDDRAAQQRRRRHLPLPSGLGPGGTPSRSTSPPRTDSISRSPRGCTGAGTSVRRTSGSSSSRCAGRSARRRQASSRCAPSARRTSPCTGGSPRPCGRRSASRRGPAAAPEA